MKNKEIKDEIVKGNLSGLTNIQMKDLYMKANTFDVPLDTTIYRIFQFHYLLADIENKQFTLVNVDENIFVDSNENPFKDVIFNDGTDEFTLGFMGVYYCSCWTYDDEDREENWDNFSQGEHALRVKLSLRKLMDTLMNVDDKYFMLHYFAGKVSYHSQQELDLVKQNTHYFDLLDSTGQVAVSTLMALDHTLANEKEIRVIYSHTPNDNDYVTNKIQQRGEICKLPFDWSEVIEKITYHSSLPEELIAELKSRIAACDISCAVEASLAN